MGSLEAIALAVEVAGLPILEDLGLVVAPGDKVGVVGRNGAGKTSLLTVLAGERPPLRGTVTVRGSLGYLRQDPRQHAGADARELPCVRATFIVPQRYDFRDHLSSRWIPQLRHT